jgi:diguanylate cyclase (GGDEF)-like protein
MPDKLVLVVEDDANIRLLLTELLQARGLRVATLPDGERVLDVAREMRPGAIVLDIGLPGRHGLLVLDDLKAEPDLASIPVVMITAWCDSDLVGRAMAAGAADYIRKPFANDDCAQRILAAVDSRLPTGVHELTEDVRRLMREDRLTGLPNRLGLEELFAERLADAQVREVPLALVMLRVDRFEEISQWGDASANDLLLRMLAADVARRIRPGDVIGRLSEDTLLVIAPRCDLAAAGKLAEILRAGGAGVQARAGWTISAGYSATNACEPDELLACCDIALTVATDAGGDLARAGVPSGRLKVA